MGLADWLDDLTVRFLLNLPASELSSVPRLCFQVEEAQWYYEDFVRPVAATAGNQLPSLPLRTFCLKLFQHCPLLSGFTDEQHIAAYEEFLAYKVRVPVRGAILMDESMEKLVLVKGWKKGASWSFPRGKINKDERDLDCAIREVYEETGYDVRQAGLVPENEEDVKYIDITMREQHMRLFVFRGVAEDTYFEPKTRKEISKIAWYNVRDLPGFKKQKGGAENMTHANKFYMVAPFLGPLKRWINQEKRNDTTAAATGSAAPVTDYEDQVAEYREPVQEFAPPAEDRSKELRRLMGLDMAPQPLQPTATAPLAQHPNDLLALLRGGSMSAQNGALPHTPLEQIDAFPQQPESPHPHHARHPSTAYQQRVPQFPFSPQNLQQQHQQQDSQLRASGGFDPVAGFMQPPGNPVHPVHNANAQHFHQQRQPFPVGYQTGPQHGQQNGRALYPPQQQQQPSQPPPMAQQIPRHMQNQSMPNQEAFAAQGPQGPQGAIASGPPVPKAEHLPLPKMNAHSMQLLDAFKSGNKIAGQPSVSASQTQRQPSQHQNALLGLFKRSAAAQAEPVPAQQPTAPTPVDIPQRPANLQARRPTLNEITRTLPKPRVTSPEAKATAQTLTPVNAVQQPSIEIPQKTEQHHDLPNPKQPVRALPAAPQLQAEPQVPPVTIMQRPPSTQTPRSPKPKQAQPSGSPRAKSHAKGRENGTPAPAYTILTRPSSTRASRSPAPQMPASPLRNETPKPAFQPQVLRRPESVDLATVQKAAAAVEDTSNNVEDKRDQLLALFGKPPPTATTSASQVASTLPVVAVAAKERRPTNGLQDRQNSLLNLFGTSSPSQQQQQQQTPAAPSPQPPAAPHIVPERRPSRQQNMAPQHAPRQQTPQNAALLDLFHRPADGSNAAGASSVFNNSSNNNNSPGTPISPFALGTPVTRHFPSMTTTIAAQQQAHTNANPNVAAAAAAAMPAPPQRRESNLGAAEGGGKGRQESVSVSNSGPATPVEAKGFLLDFLNGVVMKEGHKGSTGTGRRM